MKYSILNGSSRAASQSGRVARYIEAELAANGQETYLCDLAGNPLPLWDESIWSDGEVWTRLWQPIKAELASSDAFVFVVPEWGGMAPPAVKNFFQLCTARELGHKPGLLVGVSSSRNGVYPIAELRLSSFKNNRLCYIPEHLIVRDVEKMLHPGEPSSEDDAYLRQRLSYCLRLLGEYGQALRQVRSSGVIDHKSFPNGM